MSQEHLPSSSPVHILCEEQCFYALAIFSEDPQRCQYLQILGCDGPAVESAVIAEVQACGKLL